MEIYKIVITGGPCAGKTTAMSWIQQNFNKKGYAVLFVSEAATEMISSGAACWNCRSTIDYQRCQMKLLLAKERVFEEAASILKADKVLIVCDRGMLDNKVYMTEEEFQQVLRELGSNEIAMRDQYDAVFHLVTAAKGAEAAYTLANNATRTETPEQAAAMDDGFIRAWTGHRHLRIIDNSTDFRGKMERLMNEISAFLGEPTPHKLSRKFLIEMPEQSWLTSLPHCRRVEIIQTYLKVDTSETLRIRQYGANGSYSYYLTRKRTDSQGNILKTERRLNQDEYMTLLLDADYTRRQIRKTRYCVTYGTLYYEIDIYPFWHDKAIVDVEHSEEITELSLLKELHVIQEVTGNPAYKNSALAKL